MKPSCTCSAGRGGAGGAVTGLGAAATPARCLVPQGARAPRWAPGSSSGPLPAWHGPATRSCGGGQHCRAGGCCSATPSRSGRVSKGMVLGGRANTGMDWRAPSLCYCQWQRSLKLSEAAKMSHKAPSPSLVFCVFVCFHFHYFRGENWLRSL